MVQNFNKALNTDSSLFILISLKKAVDRFDLRSLEKNARRKRSNLSTAFFRLLILKPKDMNPIFKALLKHKFQLSSTFRRH